VENKVICGCDSIDESERKESLERNCQKLTKNFFFCVADLGKSSKFASDSKNKRDADSI